ncbi:MAG: hypothetical protein JSR37_01840 [Verrucomicrobia bacterium]|nr:hypothetical protein [Verrucomicrobiota bacterium]MBS0635979.1 hypothetical protein [Verrucomicrobiota bacterium]
MTVQAIQFSEIEFEQLEAITTALELPRIADFAQGILSLQTHLQQNPDKVRALKKLPDWATLDFVKKTAPSQLDPLRKLHDLVLRVALAASQELDFLYSIVEKIQALEEKQGWWATVTGVTATGLTALANPWVALPIGLATALTVRRVTSIEVLLQDRKREEPPAYVKLSNAVRMFFEPASSGLWGRLRQRPSQTLGQIEIDLHGETFSCFFDNKKTFQIEAREIKRLHELMVRKLDDETIEPDLCLESVQAIDPYLNDTLRLSLGLLKATCEKAVLKPEKPLCGTVIDVPGFGNSCGLYATTLAAKKSGLKTLPEVIVNLEESWLTTNNDYFAYTHQILREMLVKALIANREFQETSRQNFISSCLTFLADGSYPAEMEAFIKSNVPFLINLCETADPSFDSQNYQKLLESPETAISISDISNVKQAMQKSADFRTLFEPLFADCANPLIRAVKQYRLYALTWGCLPQLSQRLKIQEQAAEWLQSKGLQSGQSPFYAYLSCTNFSLDGFTTAHPDCIKAEVIRFGIIARVQAEWPQIFANYLSYVQTKNCMLTADELQVLAKSWGLRLAVVEWSQSAPRARLPTIYLTNPTKYHWQVFDLSKD